MDGEFLERLRHGVAKWLVIALSIVIVIFALLSIVRIGFAFAVYSYVANWVTVRLGFDYYLAELVATVLTSLVMLVFPSIIWFFVSGKRKGLASAASIGGMALVCLLVYTVGKDVYFNRVTGEPLRYYADTPDGRVFSFTPGYDPKFGKKFEPYTVEVANNGSGIPRKSGIEFTPDANIEFYPSEYWCHPTMKVQLYDLHSRSSFWGETAVINLSLCNSGTQKCSIQRLLVWYTSKDMKTIKWSEGFSNWLDIMPGECKTFNCPKHASTKLCTFGARLSVATHF